ncbi:hypothetical protein OESDEN_02328 [Oesophagostomum dentatum]|uniref:Uncharacterized protein n=1 Tax=Oesophagostomum dentatum TaxID=61180 RepID=A0A0B1TKE2_OESDE|nr:hypothetical protein OESDEN_02328 [Oesophagostomum dentatum]
MKFYRRRRLARRLCRYFVISSISPLGYVQSHFSLCFFKNLFALTRI